MSASAAMKYHVTNAPVSPNLRISLNSIWSPGLQSLATQSGLSARKREGTDAMYSVMPVTATMIHATRAIVSHRPLRRAEVCVSWSGVGGCGALDALIVLPRRK